MALFKRLAEVIKEELFDSKSKQAPEKTASIRPGGEFYSVKSGEEQRKTATALSQKRDSSKATAVKKTQPSKPAPQKRQQAKKPEEQKTQKAEVKVTISVKIPDKFTAMHKKLKLYAQNDPDKALEEYKKLIRQILEYICEKLEIDYNKQPLKWMLRKICADMGISSKNSGKFHTLLASIQGNVEYADPQKRVKSIVNGMDHFLNCMQNGSNGDKVTPKQKSQAKNGTKNAAKKSSGTSKLSFKARETVIKGEPFDIDREYPKMKEYIDDARDDYEKQKFYKALHNIRMSLEVMVKALCRKLFVPYENREALDSMINKLDETGKFSAAQKNVLSGAKWFGNMGSHDDDEKEVTESDAARGFAEIEKVKEMFITFMTDERSIRNAPIFGTNEYYSPQRKYYGRWSGCFSYGSLMMINDYVMLKEKAEKGDVQAMMDLASGFLESSICWTGDSLIYLKKYKDPLYHPDPCDARYYYWILKACGKAYDDWKAGKALPLRYLANTLLEGIKFVYMHRQYGENLTSRQLVNRSNDQFAQAKNLFGAWDNNEYMQDDFIEMLTAMMKEYDGENLFAVVHKEKTVQDVERWRIFKRR